MKRWSFALVVLIVALAGVAPAQMPAPSDRVHRIDRVLQQYVDDKQDLYEGLTVLADRWLGER